MLWYAVLCHVMLCYVMLCRAMVWYGMLCYVMVCYVMLCYAMLCYDMLCYVMFGFHSRGSCPLRPPSLRSHRASFPLAGEVLLKFAPLKLYEAKGASWVTLSLLWFPFTPSFWLVCLITTPPGPVILTDAV